MTRRSTSARRYTEPWRLGLSRSQTPRSGPSTTYWICFASDLGCGSASRPSRDLRSLLVASGAASMRRTPRSIRRPHRSRILTIGSPRVSVARRTVTVGVDAPRSVWRRASRVRKVLDRARCVPTRGDGFMTRATAVELPPPRDLERICKGIATLDAILCAEWEY